jgi:FkbM family methyltransferase
LEDAPNRPSRNEDAACGQVVAFLRDLGGSAEVLDFELMARGRAVEITGGPPMDSQKLIFDVGMHRGEDTEFYLSRGYRVIGVEGNPELQPLLREKFASEIKLGRLHLIDRAVSNVAGTVQFAINSEATVWSSICPTFIDRGKSFGSTLNFVEVKTVLFEDLLREYGTPYYLKIDIEGMDMACVEALHRVSQKPRYISLESSATTTMAEIEGGFSELAHLWILGYRHFKYVDQAALAKLEGTLLQAEGPPIRYRYRKDGSGPFGEESPGRWLEIDVALKQMRRLIRYQNALGLGGRYYHSTLSKCGRWLRRHLKHLPFDSWYDLHARLG